MVNVNENFDKTKITVGVTGDMYSYPTTEPAPTAINVALPAASKPRGYITEDGVSFDDSLSTNEIRAWQNNTLVRTIFTEGSVEITLATLQLDEDNLTWWVGSEKGTDGSWEFNPENTGGKSSYDFFAYDLGNNTLTRIYVPEAEITDREALNFVSTDAITLGVTLTAYKSDQKGYTMKIWHGTVPEEVEEEEEGTTDSGEDTGLGY